ncbi:hypothetical protein Tco_1093600 [Tanacetum coccineum]|uniref:Uncharacterized protein n=1 Tax=Tanacetum coccineum TaxID=301880 RepID=A0ABQ5IF70_9ASTR
MMHHINRTHPFVRTQNQRALFGGYLNHTHPRGAAEKPHAPLGWRWVVVDDVGEEMEVMVAFGREGGDDDDNDNDSGGSRWWRWWWRVTARDDGDQVDPVINIIFGVGRKSPPEKFSGGGSEAAVVAGGGAGGGSKTGINRRYTRKVSYSKTSEEGVLRESKFVIKSLNVDDESHFYNLVMFDDSPQRGLCMCLSCLRELHYLLDKVVSVGTAPGPNSSDHNVNIIINGDGMPRIRTFRETLFPE